jgi:plastocyanin
MEKRFLPLVVLGALLIPAAGAQAATKPVYAGPPPNGSLKGVPEFATDNAFYPKKTTIHKGDRVSFQFRGFHNFFLPQKGEDPAELFVLDPGNPVSGIKDAAGVDFWFNGKVPAIGINPEAAAPTGGKTYNGKSAVGSGLPPDQGAPKPFKVRFTKKGRYTVYCSVHPGMKGSIVVKAKKARIPSKKQDRKRINRQKKAAAKLAKKLAASPGPSGLTVKAGNDKKGIATIAFFPANKTVKVGDKVTFAISKKSTETHNVAFAPEAYGNELAAEFLLPTGVDPRTAYPSQPPGTSLVVSSTPPLVHGNGFVNTGLLDDVKSSPLPSSAVVSFSTPGTYDYYCIVHGGPQGMRGKITVTP